MATQWISRKDSGLRPPNARKLTKRRTEQVLGITFHYTTGEEQGNPNTRAWWRQIQAWEMANKGYGDIAYNGGFDIYGNAFEGRSSDWLGGHASTTFPRWPKGFANRHTVGIAFLGDNDPTYTDVTPKAFEAMQFWCNLFFLAHKRRPYVYGHRQFKATACPGDEIMWLLEALRKSGHALR